MNTVITNDTHALSEQHNIASLPQADIPLSLNANILNASGEITEQEKVVEVAPKPKDGIYELCNARKDKFDVATIIRTGELIYT